jgi:hypothetical protein
MRLSSLKRSQFSAIAAGSDGTLPGQVDEHGPPTCVSSWGPGPEPAGTGARDAEYGRLSTSERGRATCCL